MNEQKVTNCRCRILVVWSWSWSRGWMCNVQWTVGPLGRWIGGRLDHWPLTIKFLHSFCVNQWHVVKRLTRCCCSCWDPYVCGAWPSTRQPLASVNSFIWSIYVLFTLCFLFYLFKRFNFLFPHFFNADQNNVHLMRCHFLFVCFAFLLVSVFVFVSQAAQHFYECDWVSFYFWHTLYNSSNKRTMKTANSSSRQQWQPWQAYTNVLLQQKRIEIA